MCGRYGMGMSRGELEDALEGVELPAGIEPRYNIAPTQDVLVLRAIGASTRGERVRWGIDVIAPEGRSRSLFNVRSETLLERGLQGRERVLVLATHFFEWRRQQPMLIAPRSRLMAFAGLLAGSEVAILTCTPNRTLAAIHNRMPVVVDRAAWTRWLDSHRPLGAVSDLLRPCPEDELVVAPTSRSVNDPANDTPAVLVLGDDEPVQSELPF
jgi:putative SOS response-associated peptidase YedK